MSHPRRASAQADSVASHEVSVAKRGLSAAGRPQRPSPIAAFARRVAVPALAVGLVTGGAALTLLPGSAGTAVPVTDPDTTLRTARSAARTPLPGLLDLSESLQAPEPTSTASASHELFASVAPVGTLDGMLAPVGQPAPEPTSSATTPDYPTTLAAEAGTRYAKTSVNVRQGPGTDFTVLDTLARAASLTITEASFDGWRQVSLDGTAGWVKATYLVETKPAESTGSSSGGIDTSPCSRASGEEDGLTARTLDVLRAVCNAFPSVTSFGGTRGGSGSYHNVGRAIDVMVSGDAGWEVAKWARANASSLGIIEVLYSQKIWTSQRSSEGWRSFSDRGSDSANHYDHVHISVG